MSDQEKKNKPAEGKEPQGEEKSARAKGKPVVTEAPAGEGEKAAKSGEEAAAAPEKPAQPQTAEEVFLALEGAEDKPKVLKAKGSKNVRVGVVHILATYNNTKVSVTDLNGNVIGWSSSGKLGFRGSRKSTAYASQLVSQDACRQAMGHGLKAVEVRVKGPGAGRESAVRAIQNLGIEVTTIRDVTPVPHNGCRPRKPRRV
jgi:small subunit ribosomal protein S11